MKIFTMSLVVVMSCVSNVVSMNEQDSNLPAHKVEFFERRLAVATAARVQQQRQQREQVVRSVPSPMPMYFDSPCGPCPVVSPSYLIAPDRPWSPGQRCP